MKSEYWKIVLSDYVDREKEWAKELNVEFPLYMQTYTEALSAILKNIHYNRHVYQQKREQESVFIGAGSEHIDLDESNIFAFVGERGSGKTTALYEFCRILYNYGQNYRSWKDEINLESNLCKQYYFHVMEPIDASVLEKKEDLLEVILANMYEVFQVKARRSKDVWAATSSLGRDLSNSFDQVYKAYLNLGNLREQKIYGEPVLAELMSTSNSLKLKAEVEGLVEKLLMLLGGDGDNKRETSYLIIPIDDLDLNLENGYEMLEQLHKYLASRKVIILITAHYKQMKMICENHIVDCLVPEFGGIHGDIYDKFDGKAKKISNDYLLKVLPLANRVYMPKRQLIYKRASILLESDADKEMSVKEFVLKKIALQMSIYYDAVGVKKHFCLPDTVRELVTYDDFLESLMSIQKIEEADEKGEGEGWLLYDQNHERFNKDIENRMASQVLEDEQEDLFQKLMERDIKRRAQYTVSFLRSRIERKKAVKNGNRKVSANKALCLRDSVDDQSYCYSDLLEVLYELGRTDYYDKPLVHCLLASFTSEMVREFYCYRHGNKKEKELSRERLKEFLGKTFGGKWFENVFPKMGLCEDGTEAGRTNDALGLSIEVRERPKTKVGFIEEGTLKTWKISLKTVNKSNSKKEHIWIEALTEYIPYMECLTLCFSDFKDREGNPATCRWIFEIDEKEPNQLTITNKADQACFDIFGFIGKEITEQEGEDEEGQSLCHALAEELYNSVKNYFEKMNYSPSRKADKFKADFLEKARGHSIWSVEKPQAEKSSVAGLGGFPFYNLDISYNVMKRVRSKIKQNKTLSESRLYDYYRIVYGYIAEELWKEQTYYEKLLGKNDENDMRGFYDAFVELPFIKAFGIKCEDERLRKEGIIGENDKLTKEGKLDEQMFRDTFYEAIKDLIPGEGIKTMMETQDVDE